MNSVNKLAHIPLHPFLCKYKWRYLLSFYKNKIIILVPSGHSSFSLTMACIAFCVTPRDRCTSLASSDPTEQTCWLIQPVLRRMTFELFPIIPNYKWGSCEHPCTYRYGLGEGHPKRQSSKWEGGTQRYAFPRGWWMLPPDPEVVSVLLLSGCVSRCPLTLPGRTPHRALLLLSQPTPSPSLFSPTSRQTSPPELSQLFWLKSCVSF